MKERIHLVATCGMGMGSLAGLLKESGFEVSGSDQNIYPPMSTQLEAIGVALKVGFRPENIDPPPDRVVIGNAVSKGNPEVQAVLQQKIPCLSMPEALYQLFLKGRTPMVVAGTHGKTTTTALLAWLLEKTGHSPGLFAGGVLKNLGKSYQKGAGPYFVVEGDEYDTAFFDKGPKFLHYHPEFLILNPIEFDHADIYRDLPHLMTSFEHLADSIPTSGFVAAQGRNENVRQLLPRFSCRKMTFGLSPEADLSADQISLEGETSFRLLRNGKPLLRLRSPLFGRHNIENLLGILAILLEIGIRPEEIQGPLLEFEGVKRRQELIGHFHDIVLLDDFAHHPTAIHETLLAIRGRFPKRRLWALFEPRSQTTRRRFFQEQFPAAFGPADCVLIAPVYLPEKIPPGELLDPGWIAEKLREEGKQAVACRSFDDLHDSLMKEVTAGDIVCFMSNGNFGGMIQKITDALAGRRCP